MTDHSLTTARQAYFDATTTIRHYDGQLYAFHRMAIAILAIIASLSGSNIFSDVPEQLHFSLPALGAILSLLFWIISGKHVSLIQRERQRAIAARADLLDLGDTAISEIDRLKIEAPSTNQRQGISRKIRFGWLWGAIYIILFSVFVLILASMFLLG